MKNLILLVALNLVGTTAFSKILDLRSGEETSLDVISESGNIFVLGEFHYNSKIQEAQANTIEGITNLRKSEHFDVGWEFLNVDQYDEIMKSFERFISDEISAKEFITEFLGPYDRNESYEALFKPLKLRRGNLIPLNLSRSIKRPVSQGGIEALDPRYMPEDFQLGSQEYYDRFVEAMGGHGGMQIDNYFAAQSLVDNTMAASLLKYREGDISFLVCGSFHSDYNHGVVEELNRRSNASIVSIKFIDGAGLEKEDIDKMLYSDRYGSVADFAIILP